MHACLTPRFTRGWRCSCSLMVLMVVLALTTDAGEAQQGAAKAPAPTHGKRVNRLLIRNAMVIYGNGKPAFGPTSILIENNVISRVGNPDGRGVGEQGQPWPKADAEIDATGKYVLPGFINNHAHLQDERAGVAQPLEYETKIWLACGITTIRDVGSDFKKAKQWRTESAAGALVAPRIFLYTRPGTAKTPDEMRANVRAAKDNGADGLKIGGLDRDILEALLDEAHKVGLPAATHIGVEETTAWDYAKYGVTSIEHWYGIPDAALDSLQKFPPGMNYSNEVDRFGRAGELWAQANPEKLHKVLQYMADQNVAWVPTLDIYEASRDVIRAQNLPWFKDWLHPTLQDYLAPSLKNHGSYFVGWTNTQEVRWKQNYRIWMDALKEFANRGGTVGVGDDAGFIYQLYGFGLLRELELHEEAGFQPMESIVHATVNNAKILGQESHLGRVRPGFAADLIVVNGNLLENLRILYPTGTDIYVEGKNVHGGGIEWTVKDGIPYHVPVLVKEVKDLVAAAKAQKRTFTTSPQQ